jgi:hypothetical protein
MRGQRKQRWRNFGPFVTHSNVEATYGFGYEHTFPSQENDRPVGRQIRLEPSEEIITLQSPCHLAKPRRPTPGATPNQGAASFFPASVMANRD